MSTYLAIDFGGGSGRVMAGHLKDKEVILEEVYRFPNRQVMIGTHLCWDFPMLLHEMMKGLTIAASKYSDIVSIGIDSWGVDYGLIDSAGNLLDNPRCYRDEANAGMPEKFFRHTNPSEHYTQNGIQVMPINTLYQLMVRQEENPQLLNLSQHLLFMADLFGYFLTGIPGNDYCLATTSELIDARTRNWNYSLINRLQLPSHIFGRLFMPGDVRGKILPRISAKTGLSPDVEVIAVGGHDTACAVHAVKSNEKDSAFLSSGTWSLLGISLDNPILTEQARIAGFTNEGGTGGTTRFLQNITGLWIMQCLVNEWEQKQMSSDYPFLLAEAERSNFNDIIDVDASIFATPGKMEEKIKAFLADNGRSIPQSQGDTVRCVLLSLADRYRRAICNLNSLIPNPVRSLHIMGGGSRNNLLNKFTQEALGIPVTSGPVEATAIGNILIQAQRHNND